MTPQHPKPDNDYCPVASKVAVLESEKIHLEKGMERMEKDIKAMEIDIKAIAAMVSKIESENRETKAAIDKQGEAIEQIGKKLEGKNGAEISGRVAVSNGERFREFVNGLAVSLGYSLLLLLAIGAMNKGAAYEILKAILKAYLGVIF